MALLLVVKNFGSRIVPISISLNDLECDLDNKNY